MNPQPALMRNFHSSTFSLLFVLNVYTEESDGGDTRELTIVRTPASASEENLRTRLMSNSANPVTTAYTTIVMTIAITNSIMNLVNC